LCFFLPCFLATEAPDCEALASTATTLVRTSAAMMAMTTIEIERLIGMQFSFGLRVSVRQY
jgi:hypothetical protein